eukprot:5285594-Pyramimonas_sp.AAC.1
MDLLLHRQGATRSGILDNTFRSLLDDVSSLSQGDGGVRIARARMIQEVPEERQAPRIPGSRGGGPKSTRLRTTGA